MSATERHRTVGLEVGSDDLGPRLEAGDVPDDVDAHERLAPLLRAVRRPRTGGPDGFWTEAGPDPDDIQLPGFGERYYDCGEAEVPRFCEGCGDVKLFGRTCRRSSCPRCAPAWALQRAAKAVSKLTALRAYLDARNDPQQFFHHVVLSPPADWYPARDEPNRETLLDVGKEFSKQFSDAGFVVYHPYKGRETDGAGDLGAWKDRLFTEESWADTYEDLRPAPHLHIILVGHKVPGGEVTKRLEAETGWVCHRITKGEDSSVSIYDTRDLARVVSYCLSHVGLYKDSEGNTQSATRWFYDNSEYGRDLGTITSDDKKRGDAEAAVRSVAPKTLGLAYNDLACSEEHASDGADDVAHAHTVDAKRGAVAGSLPGQDRGEPGPLELGPNGETWDTPASSASTADAAGDDQEPDVDEPERCRGRLLPIGAAPRYYTDPEVKHTYERHGTLEELRETYEEWQADAYAVPDPSDGDYDSVNEWLLKESGVDARPDPPPD